MKRTQLYVAYGSNLSVEQMSRRCPRATILGPGILKGWKLEFRTHANVIPAPDQEVPVLVWKVTKPCLDSLDIYEGYPRYYVRQTVKVQMGDEEVEGIVYVMTEKKKRLPPSCTYLATILEGYARFGFSPAPIAQALEDLERWF